MYEIISADNEWYTIQSTCQQHEKCAKYSSLSSLLIDLFHFHLKDLCTFFLYSMIYIYSMLITFPYFYNLSNGKHSMRFGIQSSSVAIYLIEILKAVYLFQNDTLNASPLNIPIPIVLHQSESVYSVRISAYKTLFPL